MSQPRRFHLFNCDNIYELSIAENLLKASKAKLGFEFSVEKHSFTLSEMSELSTNVIPKMQMDFAMFVVHAHESRLLINNDNLEYGYAKVYRALLQATGNLIEVLESEALVSISTTLSRVFDYFIHLRTIRYSVMP